jgi:hypothetical protein
MDNSFKIDPITTVVEMKISGAFNFTEFRSFFEGILNHPDSSRDLKFSATPVRWISIK